MLAIPSMVFASSYSSSLSFDSNLHGQARSFDGQNLTMSIDAYSTTSGTTYPASSYFTATLYRYHSWASDDYIGSASYKRDGYTSKTWSNVGSGSYYWDFSKAIDGWWVKADSGDVKMYN